MVQVLFLSQVIDSDHITSGSSKTNFPTLLRELCPQLLRNLDTDEGICVGDVAVALLLVIMSLHLHYTKTFVGSVF